MTGVGSAMYTGRPRVHRPSTHSPNAVLALGAGGVVLLACGMTIKHLFGAVSRPLWITFVNSPFLSLNTMLRPSFCLMNLKTLSFVTQPATAAGASVHGAGTRLHMVGAPPTQVLRRRPLRAFVPTLRLVLRH